ncbi:MAG: hypothetical protein ACO3LW_07025 [bacterium]|jgi:hypothetical protein
MMIDNDFGSLSPEHQFLAQYLPKVPNTRKPEGYYREFLSGNRKASMSGTGITPMSFSQSYRQKEGGPMTIVNMPSQALDTQLALDSMGFMQGML